MSGTSSASEVLNRMGYKEIGERHCADVFAEIVSYSPIDIPVEPYELRCFNDRPAEYRFQNQDKFYAQEFMKQYLNEKWKAELYNRDCYLRLLELREQYHGDISALREIGKRITLFVEVISRVERPFLALKIDVSREIVAPVAAVADWTE